MSVCSLLGDSRRSQKRDLAHRPMPIPTTPSVKDEESLPGTVFWRRVSYKLGVSKYWRRLLVV
jgi:hypothetical protein